MSDFLVQSVIVLTSLGSAWFLGLNDPRRRWGFVISLIGQPFWIWTAIQHRQWGVLFGAFWFAYCGIRGVRSHFYTISS